jgi:hypothetical protein
MTYLIEYLGEFEFTFETVLSYVSGDQLGYFEGKKTESKISRLGTFKGGNILFRQICFINLSIMIGNDWHRRSWAPLPLPAERSDALLIR